MTYVDSDGVVADFDSWVLEHNNNQKADSKTLHTLMVEHPYEFYRDFRQIPGSQWYLDNVKSKDDWIILTAIPRFEKLAEYTTPDNAARLQAIFRENKYLWFEERGIPRNKVIILDSKRDKEKYSKVGDVLYDDFTENINAWNKHGGTGILVNAI